jgi:hypothetical protein
MDNENRFKEDIVYLFDYCKTRGDDAQYLMKVFSSLLAFSIILLILDISKIIGLHPLFFHIPIMITLLNYYYLNIITISSIELFLISTVDNIDVFSYVLEVDKPKQQINRLIDIYCAETLEYGVIK